jgi:trigger factor
MQVSLETSEGLERTLTVQLPSATVDAEVAKRLQDLSRQVRIDGFRPGKVPLKVVRQRYGLKVRQEVVGDLVQSSYAEAITREALTPAGVPDIELQGGFEQGDLAYRARLEVMPVFEVLGLEALTLERPRAGVEDADVDRVLDDLRRQQVSYEPTARAADEGDRVLIDFDGHIDGEPFEGNSGEEQPVVIGSGGMPPEFEDALRGLAAGDSRAIEYRFADDFPNVALQGRTAVFETVVKAVEAPVLPPLDDTLAEAVGLREGGLEALKTLIRGNLEREAERASQDALRRQLLERIDTANAALALPEVMVREQIRALREQMMRRIEAQVGPQGADFNLPDETFASQARRFVRLGLCINKLIQAREVQPETERMREKLMAVVGNQPNAAERMQQIVNDERAMRSLQLSVLEDQVADLLIAEATVTEVEVGLDTLLKPPAPLGTGNAGSDDDGTVPPTTATETQP